MRSCGHSRGISSRCILDWTFWVGIVMFRIYLLHCFTWPWLLMLQMKRISAVHTCLEQDGMRTRSEKSIAFGRQGNHLFAKEPQFLWIDLQVLRMPLGTDKLVQWVRGSQLCQVVGQSLGGKIAHLSQFPGSSHASSQPSHHICTLPNLPKLNKNEQALSDVGKHGRKLALM